MRHFEAHQGAVNALAFLADGRLVSGGQNGSVKLWDTANDLSPQDVPDSEELESAPITAIAAHPNQSRIAWGQRNGIALCWDVESQTRWSCSNRVGPVSGLAFLNEGRQLAIAFGQQAEAAISGAVEIFNTDIGKLQRRFTSAHAVLSLCAEPKGKNVFWGGSDRRISTAQLTAQDHRTSLPQRRDVRALAVDVAATNLAAADDYIIHMYEVPSLRENRQLVGHKGRIDALAFTHDGRHLISGSWDNQIKIWDVDTGHETAAHDWGIGNIRAIALAPDGMTAAAAGDRGIIALWDLGS
ncbi:MAG: WD40 repeat domain-containing protein [Gemmataceae bacterium]